MLKEFKAFLLRGNVVDLAVGIVIGAAFVGMVQSLVENILTPLVGLFGTPDFSSLSVRAGKAHIAYGAFLNSVISFVMVAAAVFFFAVKPVNKLMGKGRKAGEEAPANRECPHCLSSIPKAAVRCAFCTQEVG